MKSKRRVARVVVGLLFLAGAGLILWLVIPPAPGQVAFDRLPLAAPVKDIEALLPPSGAMFIGSTPPIAMSWAGRVDGQVRHFRVGRGEFEAHPLAVKSTWVRLRQGRNVDDGAGWVRVDDPTTGRVIASERRWHWGRETVVVVAGPDGRVLEKLLIQYNSPSWLGRAWYTAMSRWPF